MIKGLILPKKAYFKKPIHWVNLLVVLSSFLMYVNDDKAKTAFKLLRLIRVLQILDYIPSKKNFNFFQFIFKGLKMLRMLYSFL